MVRINYKIKAKSPIHHGSDENLGIERKLRRLKIIISNPKKINSSFGSLKERRNTIVDILLSIFKSIDKTNMEKSRLMKIWDEFTSKVLNSIGVQTKEQFLTKLSEKWNLGSISDFSIIDNLNKFDNDEFLQLLKNEWQYLILMVRIKSKIDNSSDKLFVASSNNKEDNIDSFNKNFEEIPYISGNSIRGILRRLLMYDFIKKCEIEKLSKNSYHQLFTGGVLDSSGGVEDIEKRELMVKMCTPLGLLGSAIGNMTIQGNLKVANLFPSCIEMGTGEYSFWNFLDSIYQTRRDDSKTEKDIEIKGEHKNPTQMKYYYEVFIPNVEFNHSFVIDTDNELQVSCFWQMIELFKAFPFIGGSSAVGNGEVELIDLKIPKDNGKLYRDYLEKNKKLIKEYWEK